MGLLNKTYFKFNEPFWDKDNDLIGHIGEQKGVWAEFLNLYKYTGEPVLLGFNAADYARSLEPLTDEQIIADGMRVLRTLYGQAIPEPQATFSTRWAADPFAGGSYSFVPPGAGEADYEAMAEPVANQLFFAGEATHPEYPSTVHGALLSGYREAKRIMRLED
jgi:monoamine oxidase